MGTVVMGMGRRVTSRGAGPVGSRGPRGCCGWLGDDRTGVVPLVVGDSGQLGEGSRVANRVSEARREMARGEAWTWGRTLVVGILAAAALGCSPGAQDGRGESGATADPEVAPPSQSCRPSEGSGSAFQLTGSSLTRDSTSVTITWATSDGERPERGPITYWAYLIHYLGDPEGDPDIQNYRIWITYGDDGRPEEFSIRSYSDDTQVNLEPTPPAPAQGQTLSATVPLARMPGIDRSFSWSSGLMIDGEAVSSCPNDDDLLEYPN